MNKKILFKKLIPMVIILILTSCSANNYKAGNYEGVGKGRNGDIRVLITIDSKSKIEKIELLEYTDNEEFIKASFETVKKNIIDNNSTNVDAVSGATATSNGMIEAVENALNQAK